MRFGKRKDMMFSTGHPPLPKKRKNELFFGQFNRKWGSFAISRFLVISVQSSG
jgi:hypothetical protein